MVKFMKLINNFFNGKLFLANTNPTQTPKGKLDKDATVAIFREIKITLISSSEKLIIISFKSPSFKDLLCFFFLLKNYTNQ